MNAWEEKIYDRQEAYEEGHAVGATQEKRIIAKNFKESGIPIEVIAKNTGLSIEEIEAL